MNHHYEDIRSRIATPPLWWDEHAVPRYRAFSPRDTADIYAVECALVTIACQGCGARFDVAFSWSRVEWRQGVPTIHEPSTVEHIRAIHYGDPPNIGCCPSGPTMNCEDIAVREFWRQADANAFEWERVPELGVVITEYLTETK